MGANGTNHRGHTYEPDRLVALPLSPFIATGYVAYLIPWKKALRDTKINQHTCYMMLDMSGATGPDSIAYAKVCLYRWERGLASAAGGDVVARKVTNSEVSATFGPSSMTITTAWPCPTDINLEGGGYWWGIVIYFYQMPRTFDILSATLVGINDADSNIHYPKYNLTLASAPTLPATITTSALARNTTIWPYASSEWY